MLRELLVTWLVFTPNVHQRPQVATDYENIVPFEMVSAVQNTTQGM